MTVQKEERIKKYLNKQAEALRLLQLDLVEIKREIVAETDKLDKSKQQLKVVCNELELIKQKQSFYRKIVEDTKHDIEHLTQERKRLKNLLLSEKEHNEEVKAEWKNQIEKLRNTVSDLGGKKEKLLAQIAEYKKQIKLLDTKLKRLDTKFQSRMKFNQIAIEKIKKELSVLLSDKENILQETLLLKEKEIKMKAKFKELEKLQKYLNTRQKQINRKEQEVEKIFHLLNQ